MSQIESISVTRLVRRMKNLLEIELGELWVEGEISNLRIQTSGHHYFTLKDKGGQISAVMFKGNASRLGFRLEDGMQVVVFAEASLYEARGTVQLIIRKVEKQGQGDLQRKFDELKAKLLAEGLFDKDRKKPIPEFPMSIGIISSASGAALQDMLNVLKRRAPWVQPYLYPVNVQGVGAEVGIANAITEWSNSMNGLPQIDVLLVARGGGSIEDLWNFNEEIVARALADCKIPTISGVGHEIDFTIVDFVADLRAPTPSAAIELAVPEGEDLQRQLQYYEDYFGKTIRQRMYSLNLQLESASKLLYSKSPDAHLRELLLRLESLSNGLEVNLEKGLRYQENHFAFLSQKLIALDPSEEVAQWRNRVEDLSSRLDRSLDTQLEKKKAKLENLTYMNRALGPEKVFARGFTMTKDKAGNIIRDAVDLDSGDSLYTYFGKDSVKSTVDKD